MNTRTRVMPFIGDPGTVHKLSLAVRRLLKAISFLLPAIIAGLSIRDISPETVISTLTHSNGVIWKGAVVAYFLSLVIGANSDIDDQLRVFRHAPNDGKLPRLAYLLIVLLAVAGGILAYSPDFATFAIALAVFWSIFALGWAYMVRAITRPMIAASKVYHEAHQDYADLERLAVVSEFVTGRWQVWRYLTGGLIAAVMLVLFMASLKGEMVLPKIGAIDFETVKALGMLLFVVIVETWMWVKRVRMKALLMGLDRLSERFAFTPLTGSPSP